MLLVIPLPTTGMHLFGTIENSRHVNDLRFLSFNKQRSQSIHRCANRFGSVRVWIGRFTLLGSSSLGLCHMVNFCLRKRVCDSIINFFLSIIVSRIYSAQQCSFRDRFGLGIIITASISLQNECRDNKSTFSRSNGIHLDKGKPCFWHHRTIVLDFWESPEYRSLGYSGEASVRNIGRCYGNEWIHDFTNCSSPFGWQGFLTCVITSLRSFFFFFFSI